MQLKSYWQLAKISWMNSLVYRLNFVMWRVRNVIQLLAVYFLWLAIFKNTNQVFNYHPNQILTYILGSAILRSWVFSARSADTQAEIATGDLNNYLVKPINYFKFWFTRDLADKLLNLTFATVELALLWWWLKPAVVWPNALSTWLAFGITTTAAALAYFYFNLLVGMTTFWLTEQNGWPQRFFIFMILEFLAGGLFPLDILPAPVFRILRFLPTSHFLYTPMQVFLGRLTGPDLWLTWISLALSLIGLWQVSQWVFNRGLKIYGAYGR